jgi:predicted DNA-binding protein with PD1-like motif
VIVIDVRNAELVETIAAEAKERGITDAAIVSLIGGVDSFTVSTMPELDATKDIVADYSVPAEMHGSGEIKDGVVHVHATFGVEGDRAVVGHVHAAHIGTWFARAYLLPVD